MRRHDRKGTYLCRRRGRRWTWDEGWCCVSSNGSCTWRGHDAFKPVAHPCSMMESHRIARGGGRVIRKVSHLDAIDAFSGRARLFWAVNFPSHASAFGGPQRRGLSSDLAPCRCTLRVEVELAVMTSGLAISHITTLPRPPSPFVPWTADPLGDGDHKQITVTQ